LLLIRGKKKKNEKSKPATTTTKNSSYQSSKNRQFSEGFVYKQLQDVKSNTALTL